MTDIYEIAKEVEAGKWGNTAAEKKASLSEAGYDYTEIKKCIKELKNKEPKEEVVEEQKQPEVVTLNIVKEPEVISEKQSYIEHIVKRAESLYSIASLYGKNYRVVADDNGLNAPYKLYCGQILKIYQ